MPIFSLIIGLQHVWIGGSTRKERLRQQETYKYRSTSLMYSFLCVFRNSVPTFFHYVSLPR